VRRTPRYLLAWAATTSLAVTVSWFGIQAALDRALSEPQAVPAAVDDPGHKVAKLPIPAGVPRGQPSPSPGDAPNASATASAQASRSAGPSPSPSPSATPRPTPTGSRGLAGQDEGTPTPSASPTPTGKGSLGPDTTVPGYVYRIDSTGGSAWISYAADDVHVTNVVTAAGYAASVEQRAKDWVVVTFTAKNARSTVNGYWWYGPYTQVSEDSW